MRVSMIMSTVFVMGSNITLREGIEEDKIRKK